MSFFRAQDFREQLLQIRKNANPQRAVDSGASTCQRSGACCWQRPCELRPGDPEKLAAHLGITVETLFQQHLVVDDDGNGLLLRPRRVQQTGGRYLTSSQSFDIETPCTFLRPDEQNACAVHPVKPAGGSEGFCGMSDAEKAAIPPSHIWDRDALIALGWDGETGGDWDRETGDDEW